jgi:hypothetical protein
VPVEGTSGSTSFPIKFGYTDDYTAGTHGLNPATTFDGTVADDPSDAFVPGGPGTVFFDFDVPAGTAYTRFQLFDDYTDGNDDLDLYVYRGGTLVGASGGGTSAEVVNLTLPAKATYRVYVHGWQTDGPEANFRLFAWNVGLVDDAGNMTVTAPAAATIGPASIDVSWSGLSGRHEVPRRSFPHRPQRPTGPDRGERRHRLRRRLISDGCRDAPGSNPRGVFFGAPDDGV